MEAIVASVVGKLAEFTVKPVLRQFGYLIHYKSNVARLNNQVEMLNAQRDGVKLQIDAATRNSETILPEVEIWLAQVDQTLQNKEKCFENERTAKAACCSNEWFPNLKIRHSLSRKAKKMTPDVDGLLDKKFEAVACAAQPPELGFQPTQHSEDSNALVTNLHEGASSSETSKIMNFESRKSTIEDVMEALKGNQANPIVICGMGGVGKTTMVGEVVTRARTEGLFHEYTKAVVSVVNEKPDITHISKIQSDIAEFLGLDLKEQGLEARADKLRKRLSGTMRVLVVLDNVWETLDLREIGIPSGLNSCKILVTSRSQDIFNDMEETRKKFPISVLPRIDAWRLFKKMAGDGIESDPELHSIAKQVLKKCDGLPVAISTLGSTLRRKTKPFWKDTLGLLQKPFRGDIPGMKKNVYQSIRLSYDFLEREEAKSCFLLCCIFRESTNIPVEDLVTHGFGLGVFHRIDSIERGRDRVEALVDTLKRCYLLLDSDKEECVRMHDMVRAVGLHIASAESKCTFLIRHGEASENWTRGFICTSLTANKSTHELLLLSRTNDERRSDVDTLGTLNAGEDLKVLDISVPYSEWISFILSRRNLKLPLVLMRNIQTLCLRGLVLGLETISMIGDLRTLTILRLGGSSIEHVPEEFKNLCNLKLLDLADCLELKEISPGVISSLTKLEELYLWDCFGHWNDVQIIQLSSELLHLPLLTNLETTLSVDILQNSRHLSAKLKRFKLCILKNKILVSRFRSRRLLFKLPANPHDNLLILEDLGADCSLLKVSVLLKKTHFLYIGGESLAHPFNVVDAKCGRNLKGLTVRDCHALEYLVDLTLAETTPVVFPVLALLEISGAERLKEIFHGLMPEGSLKQLGLLIIRWANELRHVWKTERQFDRLESLTLTDCQSLQVIVAWQESGHHHEEEANEINFPNLTRLELGDLPSLVGICSKKVCKLNFPQLLELRLRRLPQFSGQWLNGLAPTSNSNDVDVQHLFDPKVDFPVLRNLYIRFMHNLEEIWHNQLSPNSFCELRELEVGYCDKISHLVPTYMQNRLQKLQKIYVFMCSSLQEIFELRRSRVNEDEGSRETPSNIYQPDQGILQINNQIMDFKIFQHLTNLSINGCESLRKVCSSSIARSLVNLEKLEIGECNSLEEIVAAEEGEEAEDNNMFPHLRLLTLRCLPNLVSFSREKCALAWPSMEDITITDCPEMKKFCSGSLITSMEMKIEISGEVDENIHRELDMSKRKA